MDQRLSLITLGVADVERSRKFYEALGWEGRSPGRRRRLLPGRRDDPRALGPRQARRGLGRERPRRLLGSPSPSTCARPRRSDAIAEEVRARAGTVTREPAETFWGGYSLAFTDPDGHPWEIAHNPFWTVTDDGRTLMEPE